MYRALFSVLDVICFLTLRGETMYVFLEVHVTTSEGILEETSSSEPPHECASGWLVRPAGERCPLGPNIRPRQQDESGSHHFRT
ncbi:hypothetical protein B0H14DRAFT_2821266 [Mycena olivaceomarginata]|nr:hypothetical protein B0H14DRAFT_2821266 [Mycena olivaceomarginata]